MTDERIREIAYGQIGSGEANWQKCIAAMKELRDEMQRELAERDRKLLAAEAHIVKLRTALETARHQIPRLQAPDYMDRILALQPDLTLLPKLRDEIESLKQCAEGIQACLRENDCPKDELWIPTIECHANVMVEDSTALLQLLAPEGKE